MSPETEEPEAEYSLTPRTEAKYNKIDEDFQLMVQRNQMASASGGRNVGSNTLSGGGGGNSATNYTIPVSVPVPSGGTYGSESAMLQASPQMSHTNISPRPSSSETDSVPYCE